MRAAEMLYFTAAKLMPEALDAKVKNFGGFENW